MAQQYYAKSLSAITDAATINLSAEFTIDIVLLIANDSTTGDLHVKLDGLGAVASDWIVLKPGEQLKNIELPVTTMQYKSSTGTVLGRFLGLNN